MGNTGRKSLFILYLVRMYMYSKRVLEGYFGKIQGFSIGKTLGFTNHTHTYTVVVNRYAQNSCAINTNELCDVM